MTMRVEIDRTRCAMAGECVYNHPWLFAFDDEDLPVVLVDALTEPQQIKEARQAVTVCPSGAISVFED
jgi:ferredoxin